MTTAAPTKPRKKGKKKPDRVVGSAALKGAVDVVAEQFREALEKNSMKPEDLAKKMHVSLWRARQILDGHVLSLRTIIAVCDALGVKFYGLQLKSKAA